MRRSRVLLLAALCAAVPITPVLAQADTPSDGPAQVRAKPDLQLPFACGTRWLGDNDNSSAHRNYEIDWNLASGAEDRGKKVLAAAGGQIIEEGGTGSDYGNYLVIGHGGGYATLYAHLRRKVVHDGDTVRQGQHIGNVGATDDTPGISPHLHFEFRDYNHASSWPDYIRPVTINGDPFDYSGDAAEIYTSRNCGSKPEPDYGISAVRHAGGLSLFARAGEQHRLAARHRNDGKWGSWNAIGGSLASGPDATSRAKGAFDVVARGADGKLKFWHKSPGKAFGKARDLSRFKIAYAPAVVAVDEDHLLVLAVKADGKKMVKRHLRDGEWGDWMNVAGSGFTSGPDAALRAGGSQVDIAIRSGNGRTWHAAYRPGAEDTWTDWHKLGGPRTAAGVAPGVASRAADSVDLMVRDGQGQLWRRIFTDGGWKKWHRPRHADGEPLKAEFSQGPDIVANVGGTPLQLFARTQNGTLASATWTGKDAWGPVHEI